MDSENLKGMRQFLSQQDANFRNRNRLIYWLFVWLSVSDINSYEYFI